MKRKLIVFCLLLLSVALLLTACGPNNAERYEEAKKLLYNRQYAEAVKAFEELKGYEDSSKYATYAKLLDFGDQGQYDDAISGLRSMGDFADATLEAIYYTARKQESVEAYEEATDSYTRVITFRDSMARRSALPDKILDRDFRNASAALKAESIWYVYSDFESLASKTYSDAPKAMFEKIAGLAKEMQDARRNEDAYALLGILQRAGYEEAAGMYLDAQFAEADDRLKNGDLDNALSMFTMLSEAEYAAADEKILETRYALGKRALEEDRLEEAKAIFAELAEKEYADAATQFTECLYRQALAVEARGKRYAQEAYDAFAALGDYSDSAAHAAAYTDAYAAAEQLIADGAYMDAKAAFDALGNYADSAARMTECDYLYAGALLEAGNIEEARALYVQLGDYENSAERILACDYQAALRTLESGAFDDAKAQFAALGDYEDSARMVQECDYRKAAALVEAGEDEAAYALYQTLKGYADTDEILTADPKMVAVTRLLALRERWAVGNTVAFGRTEQDGDTENGEEPIEWRIIDANGDERLVISARALAASCYNEAMMTATDWESCSLHAWLGGFSETALAGVAFRETGLLTVAEARSLFADDGDRCASFTPAAYAAACAWAEAQMMPPPAEDQQAGWWLRDSGSDATLAAAVNANGSVNANGDFADIGTYGVRPVIWLTIFETEEP